MKKDIYIIRNTINDKVYIGQAKDASERWAKHLSAARRGRNQVINKAMRKLGIANFYYQILEEQVENYDEREKFWIEKYNCRIPNGYNVSPGGNGTGCGFDHPSAYFDSVEDVEEVVNLLKTTNISIHNIAKEFGCSEWVISEINLGKTYHLPDVDYPIRKTRYDKELIKQIHYSLQYELDKSIRQIAREYQVDLSQVNEINKGTLHPLPNKKYPLRSGRPFSANTEVIDNIIDALQNSDMMMQDIARKYNVSKTLVSSVNKGSQYFKENINYPIRVNYQANPKTQICFSPDELQQIEEELRGDKSIRNIASEHETSYSTIININNGTIIKYRKNNINYPIRKLIK